jgi:uncharacterized membrane protein YbaN (DUF454 family)
MDGFPFLNMHSLQVDQLRMNSICRSISQPRLVPDLHSSRCATWTGLRKTMGLIAAALCVVLATLGILLPLLPATPSVLLASYFLCRCSPGMHHRFASMRLFSQLLTDWEVHGGIRRRHKIRAIVVFLCSGCTLYFGNLSPTLTGLIVTLISVGVFVILRVPLVRETASID